MDFGLTKEQKLLVERVDRLVKERVAPRAANYDLALEAPAVDIHELHREGWLVIVNVLVIGRTRIPVLFTCL